MKQAMLKDEVSMYRLQETTTSGDEIEDCHNQRDGDTNQSGID